MSEKRKYDSTVARIAGNIASGIMGHLMTTKDITHQAPGEICAAVAVSSVAIARAIVQEVQRTEPETTETT